MISIDVCFSLVNTYKVCPFSFFLCSNFQIIFLFKFGSQREKEGEKREGGRKDRGSEREPNRERKREKLGERGLPSLGLFPINMQWMGLSWSCTGSDLRVWDHSPGLPSRWQGPSNLSHHCLLQVSPLVGSRK